MEKAIEKYIDEMSSSMKLIHISAKSVDKHDCRRGYNQSDLHLLNSYNEHVNKMLDKIIELKRIELEIAKLNVNNFEYKKY